MLTQVLFSLLLSTVCAVALVELVGYLWHRFAEHLGWLGDTMRYCHWVHHELDYPVESLRPSGRASYRKAGSWTWFALGGAAIVLMFLLLPLADAAALALGVVAYSWGVISYLHCRFHVDSHWLQRFAWFRRLRRLHDIHHWQPCNYGILFFGLDRLFGTLREDFPAHRQNIFPGYITRP
jgi:sterol desaturase/sphingolipid hydroxylase (fatty acid hydroxylase superfamily)